MRVLGGKVRKQIDPLSITSSIHTTGGTGTQYYDGSGYTPNREGSPSSPLLLEHIVNAVPTSGEMPAISKSTKYYEDGVLITSSTPKYTLIDNKLRVEKNIPGNTTVMIEAITEFVDPRSTRVYKAENVFYLTTVIKDKPKTQLTLSNRGLVAFDAFDNPNVKRTVTATVQEGDSDLSSYTGVTFKWLNNDGLDVIENELYGDAISANGRTLTYDQTVIDKDTITCEAWRDGVMLGSDSFTAFRDFVDYNTKAQIPELLVHASTTHFNCTLSMQYMKGVIDVDKCFLVDWGVRENGVDRKLASGASVSIPVSAVNLNADVQFWYETKRRMGWAALVDNDGAILVDENNNILIVEDYE